MPDLRTQMFRSLAPGVPPTFDWSLAGADVESERGLESAIILSIFTDRRAEADDVIPDGTDDRRGWWADAHPEIEADMIGSRLWLLSREKEAVSAVLRAREYVQESLAWLIEDGAARRVDVRTGWVDRVSRTVTDERTLQSMPGVLGIEVVIYRAAEGPVKYRFESFWGLR